MFRKRKSKDDEDLDLDEGEIIDLNEFEEFEDELKNKKELKLEDIERTFIFHIENGCPICGGDVKGNDHFSYFCSHCNVLFEKKDILEKEFGKNLAESGGIGPVRKTVLSPAERKELERKRKELKDRIFKTFSEEQKEELKEQAEEEPVEEEIPEPVEEVIDEEPEQEEEPEPAIEEPEQEEELKEIPEPEEEEPEPEPEEEYELETSDKILASSQSNKMHKGNCHFVKKIHPQNRIYLNSIEDGEEHSYSMCVCLRRLKAMQR